MFYSLTGVCTLTGPSFAVIDCGGVGFKCATTLTTLRDITVNEKTTLYTYLNVREDALDLYGFSSLNELDYFKILLSVSGVGPKLALAILSDLTPDKFAAAVSLGDHRVLTKVSGVGAKTAQRIVLELKDKLTSVSNAASVPQNMQPASTVDVALNETAVEALQALGFNKSEASDAVVRCGGGKTVEEILGKAHKMLAR